MRKGRWLFVLAIAACGLVAGCDSSSTAPDEPRYDDISGQFSASIAESTAGAVLVGRISFNISQNHGDISGTWTLSINVTTLNGVSVFEGSGAFTGTIQPGGNPSVRVNVRSTDCPWEAVYAGSHETSTRILRVTGPFDFLGAQCEVLASSTLTLVLTR